MKLNEITEYLEKRFPKVDPLVVLPAIRGDIGVLQGEEFEDEGLVTDMFVTKPLSYITLEKEDAEQAQPNFVMVFSFTRGPELPEGITPDWLVDDLIEAKYGYRPRFSKGTETDLKTILGWQSPGFWRAGVRLFVNDEPTALEIEDAVRFTDTFAGLVSSITLDDLWRLRSKFGSAGSQQTASLLTNLQARIFEERVASYIRRKYGYFVETRFNLPYLPEQHLDVYAVHTINGSRRVTACECKLVLGDRPISRTEVALFLKKIEAVKAREGQPAKSTAADSHFDAWFVTNARHFVGFEGSPEADFNMVVASLPKNWPNQDSWEVISLELKNPSELSQDSANEGTAKPDWDLKDLDQFYGTQEYFTFNPTEIKGTDGIRYIMKNGYSWFVDEAVVNIWWNKRFRSSRFLAVKLRMHGGEERNTGLTIEDGNNNVLYSQMYQRTSARRELTLYYENGVLLLPGEH